MVGRHPNAPAAFTPEEIAGTHFQRLSRPQGTWFCGKEPRKKSQVTPPGIDPGTVRLVAQLLNHYATPGTDNIMYRLEFKGNCAFFLSLASKFCVHLTVTALYTTELQVVF